MKKQMMMLLAIAAMVGCSKSEVVDNPNGDGNTPIKLEDLRRQGGQSGRNDDRQPDEFPDGGLH